MNNENLVHNPNFALTNGTVDGWSFTSPREILAPDHYAEANRLVLKAKGDKYTIGCWKGHANLTKGNWYKASIRVKMKNIESPATSLFVLVAKRFMRPVGGYSEETLMELVFHDADLMMANGNEIELYLLNTPTGEVEFYDLKVVQVEKPKHRIARVANVKFGSDDIDAPLTMEQQRARIAKRLDEAGVLKPDIVITTEFSHLEGVSPQPSYFDSAEELPHGPLCELASAKAKQYNMYVIVGLISKRDGHLFNTMALFGRNGEFVGQYDKTHLTFYELQYGISCGDSYPIFELDFGKIAMHICYDEWFPEVSSYYAHNGAEIIFLSVMGGKPITWRTRALDTGVYFVASATGPPSMIINSSGAILAQTDAGVIYYDLNLDYRFTNWYGDPTLSYGMPCLMPEMRHTIDNKLHDMVLYSKK